MQLETNPGGTVIRANIGKVRSFGIKDPTIVMKTLSGLYSNIKRIIVQEYLSNARDAHREVGKEHIPVDVTLPTELDNSFKIRDYGPGLSVERIDDVFIMFGESTKRDGNSQTGGFGIGAKCGLAYNDKTFSVTSITKENNQNIKRIYTVFLNEDEIPEMIHLNDTGEGNGEPTNEPCGVEISIPINEYDYSDISHNIINTCQHWKVRPNVTNKNLEYPENNIILSGNGWEIYNNNNYRVFIRNIKAILDGIPYTISRETFENFPNDMENVLNLNINLYFDTGEIYPAVNRENLKINDKTKQLIFNKLIDVHIEIEKYFQDKIKNAKTLYEATNLFFNLKSKLNIDIKSVTWNGFKIQHNMFYFLNNEKDNVYEYNRVDYEDNKLRTKKETHLIFKNQKTIIVYNNEKDSTRPSIRRVKTIFDTYPDARYIQVINTLDKDEMKDAKDKGFDYLGYVNITDFKKKKNKSNKHNVKCFSTGKHGTFNHCSVDIKNVHGIYYEFSRTEAVDPNISRKDIKYIEQKYNIQLIGIPTRFLNQVKKNSNMIHLTTWIKNKIQEEINNLPTLSQLDKEIFFIKEFGFYDNYHNFCDNCHYLDKFIKRYYKKLPKNFPLVKLFRFEKLVQKYKNKNKDKIEPFENIVKLFNMINENKSIKSFVTGDIIFKKLYNETIKCFKDYPMLTLIDFWEIYKMDDDKLNIFIDYISE
ncbi:MAG: ATP-binding protein [Atribacterota bacterium]